MIFMNKLAIYCDRYDRLKQDLLQNMVLWLQKAFDLAEKEDTGENDIEFKILEKQIELQIDSLLLIINRINTMIKRQGLHELLFKVQMEQESLTEIRNTLKQMKTIKKIYFKIKECGKNGRKCNHICKNRNELRADCG